MDRRYRRAQRARRELEDAAGLRARFVRELNALAAREVPPICAAAAANWTLTAPPAPDELIDVWCALDDWIADGKHFPEPWQRSNPKYAYVRLVCALTAFDTYVRGFAR